ncbi:MAG: TIGR04282 family arsenosugar biosynthesis glycosyltransferase, partial [Bacteroidota bacterium]
GIGQKLALAAYQEMLLHLRNEAQRLEVPVVVFYGNQVPDQDLWAETGWPRRLQQGADLGERMHRAFTWGKQQGYRHMVLVGSDIPGVSAALLREAFDQLNRSDVVIGPSSDGGYYLIGLKEPQMGLFEHMPWSTDQVLASTHQRIQQHQLSATLLREESDVDTVEDLPGTFLEHYYPSSRD